MAAVLPENLRIMASRLSNMQRTQIRVRPQSNDSVIDGQTISFRLPTNTMIDLRNLSIFGMVNQEGTTAYGMPLSMDGTIERLDVVVNGQSIMGNNNDYGGYMTLMRALTKPIEANAVGRFLRSGDGGIYVSTTNSTTGAVTWSTASEAFKAGTALAFSTSSPATGDASGAKPPQSKPFLIARLNGFMGGDYVRFIDTAVLGPVEVRIRLAPASVMYFGSETASPAGFGRPAIGYTSTPSVGYTWSNVYMYLDTISFADDFYRAILASRLASGGVITIPYKNVFSFQKAISSTSDTVTFNLATQSLDHLVTTFRDSGYTTRNLKLWNEQISDTNYYKFMSCDNSTVNFNSTTTYQYMVNNMLVPTFPADVESAYALTVAALDQLGFKTQAGDAIQTGVDWAHGCFGFVQCFAWQGEKDKIISGLDTRGASSNMAMILSNSGIGMAAPVVAPVTAQCTIWASCTSTLEISAGQNVTVIF